MIWDIVPYNKIFTRSCAQSNTCSRHKETLSTLYKTKKIIIVKLCKFYDTSWSTVFFVTDGNTAASARDKLATLGTV